MRKTQSLEKKTSYDCTFCSDLYIYMYSNIARCSKASVCMSRMRRIRYKQVYLSQYNNYLNIVFIELAKLLSVHMEKLVFVRPTRVGLHFDRQQFKCNIYLLQGQWRAYISNTTHIHFLSLIVVKAKLYVL